jgi:hypothetical protein
MAITSEILNRQGLIFGFWEYNKDLYYFGHIPDEQHKGIVEITLTNNKVEKMQYNIVEYTHSFELHISNLQYTLYHLNEQEMLLIGPLPTGVHMKFSKLPNKASMPI